MLLVAPVGKTENVALIMECLGFASGAADELQEAFIPASIYTCTCRKDPPDFVRCFQKLLAAIRTRIWKGFGGVLAALCLMWRLGEAAARSCFR